jgi:hypothetical protein
MYLVQQVATQLAQTDALLDRYVNMLGKSEAVAKLIFDERWEGAEAVSFSLLVYFQAFRRLPWLAAARFLNRSLHEILDSA